MESFFDYYLKRYGGKLLFLCNLKQKDASQLKIKDSFLKEIVEHCSNLNYSEKNTLFKSTCIWHHSLITIEKKPFFYKSWFKTGVENVKDLLDEASSFISFDVFVRKFKVETNYLEYYKVVSTLTRYKKNFVRPSTETTKPKMRLKLSYPTQNCAKKLISASLKKRLQHHLKAKVNGWLGTQYETRRLIGKAHIHYRFGVLKKKN